MLHGYEIPPTFVDGSLTDPRLAVQLSEGDLDVLGGNVSVLDGLSFRAPDVISSSAGKDTSTPNAYTGLATEVIWRGSFYKASGMTDLTIEGWAQKGATEDLQLFLNGAGMLTQAVPNGAAFTLTCSVASVAVGDVGEVVIQISGARTAPQALAAKYVIYDAYVGPVVIIPTWPGAPTFASTYSAALLNQLGNCQIYLAARYAAIPYLPFLAAYYAHGSSVTGDVYPIWWGAVERANGANIMNVRIIQRTIANVSEYYRVKVNGSIVHTGAALAAGQQRDDYLSIDLSALSASTRLEATIESVITTGPTTGAGGQNNSRYDLWAVRMSNSAPALASAPYDFTADESMSNGTLNTRLNAYASTMTAAKARIDANPRIFDRVRLMPRMYGRDTGQWSVFTPANVYAQRFTRKGARLVIRGKGVRVGWGGVSSKSDATTTNVYSVDFAHELALTDGDLYQTKSIYLDALEGLDRGMAYSVIGDDVTFCSEYLL